MKLCMGCMNQIEEHIDTCPYCGFNEKTNKQESYYLNPGTVIGGKYIVGKVMNYNGYTISYMGMDAELERKVVVKEYLPSDFATRSEGENDITIYAGDAVQQFEQGLTQFLNDANTMQQIGLLEGIAQVYDCIAENDTGYVVSEYVEGKTLKDVLQNSKKLNPNKAKKIIEKILIGLGQLHAKGIIHCDISPETIVITDNGEVKLIDFGAAKYVTTANSKSLAIILKQGYAPEEQYRSKGIRGSWTDVYAVAAVMYRMITGIVPPESVERALEDNIKEPSKLGINISENVENAIMNALNVYKDNRTVSAEIFLNELNGDKVQRIKVKKNKQTMGKIPMWCKLLVSGFVAVIIIGSVFLFDIKKEDNIDYKSDRLVLKNLEGMKIDALQQAVAAPGLDATPIPDDYPLKGYCDYGLTVDINNPERRYNNDPNMDECIRSFEVIRDGKTIAIEPGEILEKGDTIICKLWSNKYISKEELEGIKKETEFENKYKWNPDNDGYPIFKPDKENGYWGDILKIEGKYENGANYIYNIMNPDENTNQINDIIVDTITITYSKNLFFYWSKNEEIPDYANNYKTLGNLRNEDVKALVYKKKNNPGEERLVADSGLIDATYYSISKEPGTIFKQTKSGNEGYDQRNDGPLILAIGEDQKYHFDGKTVKDLKTWLNKTVNLACDVDDCINIDKKDGIIEQVKVYKNMQEVEGFLPNDNIEIEIKLKPDSTKGSKTQSSNITDKPTELVTEQPIQKPKEKSNKSSDSSDRDDMGNAA